MDEDDLLILAIGIMVTVAAIHLYAPYNRCAAINKEGFLDLSVTDSASDISGAMPQDISGCAGIKLTQFNADLVLSYLSPDLAYAISSYSVGGMNYLPKIQKAFNEGDANTQMAIAALVGRYLAFNGGSAAIPGPGYTNTSPGNYVAQTEGATTLLKPKRVDKTSPIYDSFMAAQTVAFCNKLNKFWVSTADF